MSDTLDSFKNIYLPRMETKEDVLKFLEKGMFFKQNRIEEVFYQRFVQLRKKIHKVLSDENRDEFDYEVYVNSILVDCRAIFLENPRFKFNSTLQGTYRARGLNDFAQAIDEFFEREVLKGRSLKVVIKDWVDKRVVHVDCMEPEDENAITANILTVIDRKVLGNIFHDVLLISLQYEEVRALYGKNAGEQLDKVLSLMTGEP